VLDGVLAPLERITVHHALQTVTINAVYVLGLDDLVGSIEPGKMADFTDSRDVLIWGTVLGGRILPREKE